MLTLVRLYLMTNEKIVRLERTIEFARVPCVGEWLQFESSGLIPQKVTEVTHDERGNAEVVIGAQIDQDGRYMLHETDEDLQGDIDDLVKSGWRMLSQAQNKLYRNNV